MNPLTPDTVTGIDRTSQAQDVHNRASHESPERLRLAMMVANDGLWDWDLATNEVYFDPRYYLMAGYAVDAFPHRLEEFQQRIHPDDVAQVMAKAQAHLNGQTGRFEVEFRFRKRDGDYLWILGKGQIVERDAQGRPLRFVGTHSDITGRKRAEEALRESQERLELVLEGGQLGYWDWNIQTGAVYRNARWAEMLGYTLEEIEFNVKQWSDLQHPDDRAAAWQSISSHLEGRTPAHRMEYRMRAKDGQYKWILDQARIVERDAQGRPLRMSGTHLDITERKRIEAELQQKLTELQRWYEVMLDREGRVLELKREADALRQRLGEPPLYAVELAAGLSATPPAAGTRP